MLRADFCFVILCSCMCLTARPPSTEASDADNLNQTGKRRMPSEMKPKLAKIARLAV